MSLVGSGALLALVGFALVAALIPGCARALIARMTGTRVPGIVIGLGPRLATLRWGHTHLQIRAVPIGAYSQIAGLSAVAEPVESGTPDAFFNRPLPVRGLILFAGAIGYFACAIVLSVATHALAGAPVPGGSALVAGVVDGKPAARAGIREEDEIVAVAGTPIREVADVAPAIARSTGAVDVRLRRDGREFVVRVVPVGDAGARRIGVQLSPGERIEKLPLARAIVVGAAYPFESARFMLHSLFAPSVATVSGPVGVVRVMKPARSGSPRRLFVVVALLVYLALIMLVPVVPYDGGRALARLWRRQRRDVSARDLGTIAFTPPPLAASDVTMLVLFAAAALPYVLYLVPVWLFVGLLRRRPLAWSVATVTAPAMVLAAVLATLTGHAWARIAGVPLALAWLGLTFWLRSDGVRRRFGLVCAACHRPEARAVAGSDALSCLACGSVWRR